MKSRLDKYLENGEIPELDDFVFKRIIDELGPTMKVPEHCPECSELKPRHNPLCSLGKKK